MANAFIDFSTTAASNTTVGSANIAEGCAPSGLNNAARQIIAYEVSFHLDSNTIASAATTDLGTIKEGYVSISGTTPITNFGTPTNKVGYWLKFDGILTLIHSAKIILPSGANIVTAPNDVAYVKNDGTDVWRMLAYQRASGVALVTTAQTLPLGYLSGFNTSTAVDTDHDRTFAVGQGRDAANAYDISLTGAVTKQIDAAWAVGTNQGGLFSGAVANNTQYHEFVIRRSDTGVVDAGFDTSITAANIPAGYDAYRRVGTVVTDGSANIIPTITYGDGREKEFLYTTPQISIDDDNPGTAAVTRTLTNPATATVVPIGKKVKALLNAGVYSVAGTIPVAYLSDLAAVDVAPNAVGTTPLAGAGGTVAGSANADQWNWAPAEVWTNTSAQIRSRMSANAATSRLGIVTLGWRETL